MIDNERALTAQARDGLTSLARLTGRTLDEIVTLAERDELRSLFGSDGKLRTGPHAEFRAGPPHDTDAAIAGANRARQCELTAHQNQARLTDLAIRGQRYGW